MSVRRPSPSADAPPLLALSQPSRRLDEVLRAGQAHREASVASLFDKRARVQDSHTALENAQRHAREQQENVQRLNEQLLVAQEREQATREEAEFDKRELERARGSLRLRLQKLQKQLADRNALNSAQVEELARDLARAQSELAERDLAIADYSAQVEAANEAQDALQKELDDLRRVIESVPRGIEAEEPEWIREATDVLNATAPLQDSVDKLTQENSMLQSRIDELRRNQSLDRDVCEGLRAQIDGLRETFSAELAQAVASGQPQQATQSSKQMCNNANSNREQYNTDLYMAVLQGRSEDALELIQNGARLDSEMVNWPSSKKFKYYAEPLQSNTASVVLFEDFNSMGNNASAFGANTTGYQWLSSDQRVVRRLGFDMFYKWQTDDTHLKNFMWYMRADERDEAGMLQIIDALGKNPCTGTGFQLWVPTFANPTNWSPALVQRAYEKGIMPRATDWSLLNALLLWLANSPLVKVYMNMGSDQTRSNFRKNVPQLYAMSPLEVIEHERRLVGNLRALWELARALGQTGVQRDARNDPFKQLEQVTSEYDYGSGFGPNRDRGGTWYINTEWRPSLVFPDPKVFLPKKDAPYLYHTQVDNRGKKYQLYYKVTDQFSDFYKESLAVLEERRTLVLEIEASLKLPTKAAVTKSYVPRQ